MPTGGTFAGAIGRCMPPAYPRAVLYARSIRLREILDASASDAFPTWPADRRASRDGRDRLHRGKLLHLEA